LQVLFEWIHSYLHPLTAQFWLYQASLAIDDTLAL